MQLQGDVRVFRILTVQRVQDTAVMRQQRETFVSLFIDDSVGSSWSRGQETISRFIDFFCVWDLILDLFDSYYALVVE